MVQYTDRESLKNAIRINFAKYISEFEDIPEELKDVRRDNCDRTPAENLAYQVGWTNRMIGNERDERSGHYVSEESCHLTWNRSHELTRQYQQEYSKMSLEDLKSRLHLNVRKILAIIDSMNDEDLFGLHRRRWADDMVAGGKWSVARIIHVTTVAPFQNFRTKIRKWKRAG